MGIGGIAPRILNLDSRWEWVFRFTPRLLYTREKSPSVSCWIGGSVGPRAGLDAVTKRKRVPSLLLSEIEPRSCYYYVD